MSDALSKALDAAISQNELVSNIRKDMVVSNILTAFEGAEFHKFDEDVITTEISDMESEIAFASGGFSLSAASGLREANKARREVQAARDRLIAISRDLQLVKHKTAKIYRTMRAYIRNKGFLDDVKTVREADDICAVAAREVVDKNETADYLLHVVKDSLNLVDSKTKGIDEWFKVHKQYVFMTYGGNGREANQDDEEEHRPSVRKDKPNRRLGRSRPPHSD